jgi:hypothetical protein
VVDAQVTDPQLPATSSENFSDQSDFPSIDTMAFFFAKNALSGNEKRTGSSTDAGWRVTGESLSSP